VIVVYGIAQGRERAENNIRQHFSQQRWQEGTDHFRFGEGGVQAQHILAALSSACKEDVPKVVLMFVVAIQDIGHFQSSSEVV
jgi:hypothetical protein